MTIGQEMIEYRVVAEDAHTPWYQLTSRPRPMVERFKLRIVHPTYSQLPDKQIEVMLAISRPCVAAAFKCN